MPNSAEMKALKRLKSLIEDETSTTDELDEILTSVGHKNRAEWSEESPMVTAVKSKRKDFLEALVKSGFSVNSTVKNHPVRIFLIWLLQVVKR